MIVDKAANLAFKSHQDDFEDTPLESEEEMKHL